MRQICKNRLKLPALLVGSAAEPGSCCRRRIFKAVVDVTGTGWRRLIIQLHRHERVA